MQFIKPSVRIEHQETDFNSMLKHIEICGRVSYKSEDKITNESSEKFINMLISRGHTSPLEHGTIYLTIPKNLKNFKNEFNKLLASPYIEKIEDGSFYYITTNYRVVYTLNLEFIKKYWSEPTKHIKRVSIRIVCSRGIGYEIVRHRTLSITQESTRYCNYSKDKFDNCLKFIIPSWIKDINDGETFSVEDTAPNKIVDAILAGKRTPNTLVLISSHVCEESAYLELINSKCSPQQARDVLSNGLKTELIVTGTIPQWEHFLRLRSKAYGATGMHPDMEVIGNFIYYALVSAGHIKKYN